MADLATGTISAELRAAGNYFFNGEKMPDATTATSDVYLAGQTQGAIEIVGVVDTDIALADTTVLTVNLVTADNVAMSGAVTKTLYTVTASGATTIDADTELLRYLINSEEGPYCRVDVVTDDTQESGTFSIFQTVVAR